MLYFGYRHDPSGRRGGKLHFPDNLANENSTERGEKPGENPDTKPSETHRLLAAVIKISRDGCGWAVSTRQTTKFGETAEQTGFAAISPCCDEKKNTNKGLSRLNVFCSREPRPPMNLLSRVTEDAACSGERRPGQGDSEEVTFSFCLNTFSREAETCLP